ncbi:hypothetical protein AU252_01505 [Pseudarthrobacter sulfonivorans]|uniref:Uncharacterized protein n=1 Tax=Pseudarthrobacter sulfonivorans TaxID=121292 RepID=A0A0U3GLE6_9MICC|nr:hypothetical protein AU252_01505 [Pseudarthrobacter sulfonivorans]
MRSKIPELTQALPGRFSQNHRVMTRLYLHRIDAHTDDIHDLYNRIEQAMGALSPHKRTSREHARGQRRSLSNRWTAGLVGRHHPGV